MNRTEHVLEQGQALARAIEALETIQSTGPIERVQAWFLLQAYRKRLRAVVAAAPAWLAEEMLSASQFSSLACDDPPAWWRAESVLPVP